MKRKEFVKMIVTICDNNKKMNGASGKLFKEVTTFNFQKLSLMTKVNLPTITRNTTMSLNVSYGDPYIMNEIKKYLCNCYEFVYLLDIIYLN